MIKTGMFQQNHLTTLKKAVDAYAQRHQVTARNIANVETPGYKARQVRFEELLANAGGGIEGYRTDDDHLAIGGGSIGDVTPRAVDSKTTYHNGQNNVDIDAEMAELATNDLSYRLATRLLSMRYSTLRGAIKGQVR